MQQAILLLSAGLDSTLSLALAQEQGWEIAQALTFDYGQKSAPKEKERAQKIAAHYDIPWQVIELPWLGDITDTALSQTSAQEIPDLEQSQLDQVLSVTLNTAKAVWVPNRNGLFINIAAAFADRYHYQGILVGFNAEEASTFPDNTPQFAQAATQSLAFSTQVQPQVVSAVMHLNKIEMIEKALELQVPLELIWSCYRNGDQHCGRCESCNRLKRGLLSHGAQDWVERLFAHV